MTIIFLLWVALGSAGMTTLGIGRLKNSDLLTDIGIVAISLFVLAGFTIFPLGEVLS